MLSGIMEVESLETLLVQQCVRLDGISAGHQLLVNANMSCCCHVDNCCPSQGTLERKQISREDQGGLNQLIQGVRQGPSRSSNDTARGILFYSKITRLSVDQRYYLRLRTLSTKLLFIFNKHPVFFTWLSLMMPKQIIQRTKPENRIFLLLKCMFFMGYQQNKMLAAQLFSQRADTGYGYFHNQMGLP